MGKYRPPVDALAEHDPVETGTDSERKVVEGAEEFLRGIGKLAGEHRGLTANERFGILPMPFIGNLPMPGNLHRIDECDDPEQPGAVQED